METVFQITTLDYPWLREWSDCYNFDKVREMEFAIEHMKARYSKTELTSEHYCVDFTFPTLEQATVFKLRFL